MTNETIHVLLVDDEVDFTETTAYWLRSKGYRVTTVPGGKEALTMIAKDPAHIVFLDINMPGMDGIETLTEMRKVDAELPIIMVTVLKDETKFARARELGCSGFFPKEGELEELQNLIEVTIRTHGKLKRPPR